MRAVMEHHGEDTDNYPAVEVMLVRGKEDICVKVGRDYSIDAHNCHIIPNRHFLQACGLSRGQHKCRQSSEYFGNEKIH